MAGREHSVQQDWRARLPEPRHLFFYALVTDWEQTYAMLSVTLDDAIAQRARGHLVQARNRAAVAEELALRLTRRLVPALEALRRRAWDAGAMPRVEALSPENFRSERAQRAAAWNTLSHWAALGRRLLFLAKLRWLKWAVEEIRGEFCDAAQEIAEGACVDPEASWQTLDALHYDLNTAVRETTVVLKSFLCIAGEPGFAALREQLQHTVPEEPMLADPNLSRAST